MKTAEGFIADGDLKFESNDFEGAAYDYSSALKLDPNNPDVLYNRGIAQFFA